MFSNRPRGNRLKSLLCGSACAFALFASYGIAHANPEDGVVTGGNADIAYSANKLDIYQHTDRAVIDWRSFNIGASEHTQFHQPGAGSLVVNRVNDINPSQIDGKLSANGHVVLINPNGVMFGAGSRIDVGSLTVSAADISNEDAMAGNLNFNKAGNANAKIVNAGHITAREAGLVNLVAPQVENSGIIEARLGKVNLASAETFTLDMAGDGLVKVAVDSAQLQQHVKNSGSISADGGRVTMSAAAARDVVDSLIVNTGQIRAKKGIVKMTAEGANKTAKQGASKVVNAGSVDVSGTDAPGDRGGSVVITADEIELSSTSYITADGNNGGGTINIGGDYQGSGILPTSRQVRSAAGSRTTADAIEDGDGGRIIYWADDSTVFDGLITARGGALSGNGGFVETSGKANLGVAGKVDVSAAQGEGGLWLLDPSNVRIIRPGGTNIVGGTTNPATDDFTINADSIETALNGGSHVAITTNSAGAQDGDITVDATISWNSANNLSLQAHHDIIVNQAITGRNIYFTAGNDVDINADISTNLANSGLVGFYNFNAGGSIGIGDGALGDLHISNEDFSHIKDFSRVYLGNNNTQTINFNTSSWNTSLVNLYADTWTTGEININGSQTLNGATIAFNTGTFNINGGITGINGNSSIYADNYNINGDITGTANALILRSRTDGKSWGLGDGASGDIVLDNAAIDHLKWTGALYIGDANTGDIEFEEYTWRSGLNLTTAADKSITFNGATDMAGNNLTLTTGNLIVDAPLINAGGSVNIVSDTIALNDTLGSNSSSNQLRLVTRTNDQTIGVGDGTNGTYHLDNNELDNISGFGTIWFGGNSLLGGGIATSMEVAARNWGRSLILAARDIDILGDQTVNNLELRTASLPDIVGDIYASGSFALMGLVADAKLEIGLGTGAAGNIVLDDAYIAKLQNSGFTSYGFGYSSSAGTTHTNAIDLNYSDWNRNLTLYTDAAGSVTISKDVNMNNKNLSLITPTININHDINRGSGTLSLNTNNLDLVGNITGSPASLSLHCFNCGTGGSIGIGDGSSGTLILSSAEMTKLQNSGFNNINFGYYNTALDLRDVTWTVPSLYFAGNATINSAQDFGAANVTFRVRGMQINDTMTGTGALVIENHEGNMGLGSGVSTAGMTTHLDDDELGRIDNSFSSVIFGEWPTYDVYINRLTAWDLDNVTFTTRGSPYKIIVEGAQDFGAGNVNFLTNAMDLNASINGTGAINFNTMSHNIGIGIGNGATGGLNFDANELNRIGTGFSNVSFGSTTAANNTIDIQAHTWNRNVEFLTTSAGRIDINGAQNFGNKTATFKTNNININADLTGTGTVNIGTTTATTMQVGNGGSGTLHIDDAELARITGAFSNVVYGNDLTTTLDLRAGQPWIHNASFKADLINVNSAQNFADKNASFFGDEIDIYHALSGTGNLQLTTRDNTKGIEIGSTSATNLNLTATELDLLQNGWADVTIGALDHQATIAVNEGVTFKDHTTLRNKYAYGAWMVDINAPITTIDNANLTLVGGSAATNPHVWAAVHVGGDLDIAGDLIVRAQGNMAWETDHVNIGRDADIYSNTATYIDADVTTGRDFLFYNDAQAFAIMADGSVQAGRNIDINLLPHPSTVSGFIMQAGGQMQADGNITVRSHMVEIDATSSISGNVDGTSTLTFIESGENDVMEIGAADTTAKWQMNDDELAAIQDNFDKVIFGSAAMKGDLLIDSWDLSAKTFDVELYGNDITVQGAGYGLRMGTGNIQAHAIDSDATLTPADAGEILISSAITRAVGGHAKLDLRADHSVRVPANITQTDPNTDLDGNPLTNPATLDILLNANRDDQADGGFISVSGDLTSNGGNIALTGGNIDDGANGGVAGDGIADGMAMGTVNYGVLLNSSDINAGAGRIQIAGRGFDQVGAQAILHGVYLQNGSSVKTTEGSTGISIRGQGGSGLSDNHGVFIYNGHVEAYTGSVDIRGIGGDGGARNNGVSMTGGATIASKGTGASAATLYVEGQQGGTAEGAGMNISGIISSIDGDIRIKGTGGSGTTNHAAEGIRISNNGIIRSTGTTAGDAAKIFVEAQGGGTGTWAAHYGLTLYQGAIESTEGDIDITATGGNGGSSNYGLFLENGAATSRIETNGGADITIRATGGPGTTYDAIRMTGSSFIGEGALAGTASGDISIVSDGFTMVPTTGTIKTDGDITIKARTASTNIGLGYDLANALSLNDAELAMFDAGGKFVIGDAVNGTGNITIDTWDLSSKNHAVEVYGGNVNVTGSGVTTMGANNLLLNGKTQVVLNSGIAGNTAASLMLESLGVISVGSGGIDNAGNGDVTLQAGTDGSGILYLNGFVSTGGSIDLSAGTNDLIYLHTAADITGTGITLNNNASLYGTTGITRTINARTGELSLKAITAGDRDLVLTGDNIDIAGAITTDRTINISTTTAGRAINLGGGTGGLDIDDTELSYLQPGGLLTIGTATTGTQTITTDTAAFNSDVALYGGQLILGGLSSTGTVFARSQGAGNDITLSGTVSSSAAGDAITLVSADDFFNNAGAGALSASNAGGRWLVYSERMDQNTRGGLMPDAVEFNVAYPAAPAGAGNRFLYSSGIRPTLTLKVNDDEITYVEDYTDERFGFSITGGLVGGDTMNDIGLSGELDYSTSYILGGTDPQSTPYEDMLEAAAGTLHSRLGYLIGAIEGGDLKVSGVKPPPALLRPTLPVPYEIVSAKPALLTSSGSFYNMQSGAISQNASSMAQGGSGSTDADIQGNENSESDGSDGHTGGRVGLTFSEDYSFSTYGLNLYITPELRSDFDLPDNF